jgi:ABC-type polysaccharide/polyol phosphate transport system ATPase subunit
MTGAAPLLEVRDLETTLRPPAGLRRGAPTPFALRAISFSVQRGETVAVLGANGAGKTTLLRLLAGVYRPHAGGVHVRGQRSAVIGLTSPFSPELTVREHLRAYGAVMEPLLRIEAALELAGLAAAAERPVRLLSTGERTRLAMAPGLLAPVDLYLLDEALAVCDPEFRAVAVATLERRVREGAAVLVAGQDLLTARLVCRRGLLLQAGRLVLDADLDTAIAAFTTQPQGAPAGHRSVTDHAAPLIERVETPGAFADSGFTIPIHCRLRALSRPFQLLVAVTGADGAVIYSSRAVFRTPPEADASGGVSIRLGVPAGCVPPGTYRLAVAVTDELGMPLTTREDAATLSVAQGAGV